MLSQEAVEREEETIREAVNQLAADERRNYFRIVKKRIKDPDTYAVLNWFFIAGLHHFYLRRWLQGSIDLTIFSIGIGLIVIGLEWLGLAMIIGISIVELYALFRSQIIVQNYNNQVMKRAIKEIRNATR